MSRLREIAAANPLVRFAYRAKVLAHERESIRRRPRDSARFLFRGREVSNFTYEIENLDDLARFVAQVTDAALADVDSALAELRLDTALVADLRVGLTSNPKREAEPLFGYRRAAYAITRLAKPARVVEVGTHDGLGSVAIAAALERNAADGAAGTLATIDINPDAGWLMPDRLLPFAEVHVGEVRDVLPAIVADAPPEFAFQDVGHAFEHADFVFETLVERARGRRLILMSEVDDATHLPSLCAREGAAYHEFAEVPERHFWHGHTWGAGVFGP